MILTLDDDRRRPHFRLRRLRRLCHRRLGPLRSKSLAHYSRVYRHADFISVIYLLKPLPLPLSLFTAPYSLSVQLQSQSLNHLKFFFSFFFCRIYSHSRTLSLYSNWDPMDYSTQFSDPHSELCEALLGFYDPIDIHIDSLFDPPSDDLLLNRFPEQKTTPNILPSFSDPSIFSPVNDLDYFCQCPKRLKSCSDLDYSASITSSWPPVEFAVTPQFNGEEKKKDSESGDRVLSAQSIAARERRKRISEKTQELGRLIPGGNRMNTAEMFRAAFKYVKFLQAQVGILSLMGSMQDGEGSMEVTEDIEVLLKSQVMQEKLSGEGKCIVPKEMVEALAKDTEIRSSPFISRDLNRFVGELNGSK